MLIADEQALSHTIANRLPDASRALVFAPHPDDEVFGCGATLFQLGLDGCLIRTVVVTDGALGGTSAEEELVRVRRQESIRAAQKLGLDTPTFWQEPDRGLRYGERLIEKIRREIEATAAQLVFLPSPIDWHPDHQTLALAGVEAIRRSGLNIHAVFYEVTDPLPTPNVVVDISEGLEAKRQAIRCFASQLLEQPYEQRIEGLNSFRAFHLGAHSQGAEAFRVLSAHDLALPLGRFFGEALQSRQLLGAATDTGDIPLVSVIVRSMDRSTLDDALTSIARQTYPHIEVVVVNASGAPHRTFPAFLGHVAVRLIETGEPLDRARAANAGLDAAKGEWLIFLDDDDWFDPDHLAKLHACLQQFPHSLAAYTGVYCVGPDGERLDQTFATVFDPLQLIAGNFIPIHAVLFSRQMLDMGCRIDEELAVYEDWDFWIQLSRHTHFAFCKGLSAAYRIGQGSGFGVQADPAISLKAAHTVYLKWISQLPVQDLQDLMSLVRQLPQLDMEKKKIEAARKEEVEALNRTMSEVQQQLQQAHAATAAIYESSSWRLTSPLRRASLIAKHAPGVTTRLAQALRRHGLAKCGYQILRIVRQGGIPGLVKQMARVQSPRSLDASSPLSNYADWVARFDTLRTDTRNELRTRQLAFSYRPLISIVMPTYNTNSDWLAQVIESVQAQIYPNWELCIADDASPKPEVRATLEKLAKADPRIKVVFRPENGHISQASNSALALATGEWVALLDHDDLLSEHALFWVVECLNQHPDTDLIYSDEDKIDIHGNRSDPYFKCDWNLDLFYSHNLITHLGVYRTQIVREIGGFRVGLEGAQDYDLALRYIEACGQERIRHIPRILYHWRIHPESTAQSADSKPYAMLAGERALNEHFQRTGMAAKAELVNYGYRVSYALPEPAPLVSIIIPTRNALALTRQCIDSIQTKTTYKNYEIIVVDNNSDDPAALAYFEGLRQQANVRVIRDERPFNYSALNNAAAKGAKGEVLVLLNNDIEVITPGWLSEMVSLALQPGVGAVGAKLLYPDNTLQHGGVVLGIGGVAGHSHKCFPRDHAGHKGRIGLRSSFSAVTAACLAVAKENYFAVGGLNETELTVAFNDVDFCLKLKERGFRNVWTPYAELYHHESATRGHENTPEKIARFEKESSYMKARWPEYLASDPAYNLNLTLEREDFSLAMPPRHARIE